MKLKELHINNFKFFPKEDPKSPLLKIDGKNLLIYGENGSGKSTIYWALYTLLESSFKKADDDVQKYFKHKGDHGLVNVYASPANHKSSIKAVLSDGTTTTDYLVSGELPTVQAIRASSAVRESGMASDFINYRSLFKLHHAKHSSNNDLFGWFEDEILPYVRNKKTQTFGEVIKELRKGPKQVKNLAGETVYANPAMLTAATDAEKKDYKYYRSWDIKIAGWTRELKGFLKIIQDRANTILKDDFKLDETSIKLELVAPRYNVLNTPIDPENEKANLRWYEPEIRLTVPKYQNKKGVVIRPHSFLNEAKWTAIGLSIRMAILEDTTYRPSPVDLKCLVMDDMLLSLDMSNRDIVLDLLLTRYVNDYQLILMTHDNYFYELAKGKINALNKRNDWVYLEMYDDEKDDKHFPFIIEAKTDLQKAEAFFYQREYAACANHLRKATEKFVYEFLPKEKQFGSDFKRLDLSKLINKCRALCRLRHFPTQIISNLDLMRTHIFNPQSHYDVYKPLFQTELKRAIATLKQAATLSAINL